MQRRKERGKDGQGITKDSRRGTGPDEVARGRGELPGSEQEIPEERGLDKLHSDFKNDRRERRRERHE
jgi:hypothetical protein